jgi:hypothetical protein
MEHNISELIEALEIFKKYNDRKFPTHCEHDMMIIPKYNPEDMVEEDIKRLSELSFNWNSEYGAFVSFLYGSC